jgi:hypothetical protein
MIGAILLCIGLGNWPIAPTVSDLNRAPTYLSDPQGVLIIAYPKLDFPYPTHSVIDINVQQPSSSASSSIGFSASVKLQDLTNGIFQVVLSGPIAQSLQTCSPIVTVTPKVAWTNLSGQIRFAAGESEVKRKETDNPTDKSFLNTVDANVVASKRQYTLLSAPMKKSAARTDGVYFDADFSCDFNAAALWTKSGASQRFDFPKAYFARPDIEIDSNSGVSQDSYVSTDEQLQIENSSDLSLSNSSSTPQASSNSAFTAWTVSTNTQTSDNGDFNAISTSYLSALFSSSSGKQHTDYLIFLSGVALALIGGLAISIFSTGLDIAAATLWPRAVDTIRKRRRKKVRRIPRSKSRRPAR